MNGKSVYVIVPFLIPAIQICAKKWWVNSTANNCWKTSILCKGLQSKIKGTETATVFVIQSLAKINLTVFFIYLLC